jgi:cysteine desulfurase
VIGPGTATVVVDAGAVRIYLDHNATSPLDPRVRASMEAALAQVLGNPSSIHAEGRAARDAVETARRDVAALVGGAADEIVFTSGGTESDALGVVGLARLARTAGRPAVVIAPATEHPAVHGAVDALASEGFERVIAPVDAHGALDLAAFERRCAAGAAVAAVALVNHELGTLQPVAAAAAAAARHGVRVHCDAVQAAGRVPVDAAALGVDALAVSAHKLAGPKGTGALWIRRGLDLAPLVAGGHQERERRPGTENVHGIVGFGTAARLAAGERLAAAPRVGELAARLEAGLVALGGVRILGAGAARAGSTVNAGFDGALGEVIVAALDLAGVAVSAGAACTSGTVRPSPVLLAIGLSPARAVEAVRFSLGPTTTAEEIDAVLALLPEIVARARRHR